MAFYTDRRTIFEYKKLYRPTNKGQDVILPYLPISRDAFKKNIEITSL